MTDVKKLEFSPKTNSYQLKQDMINRSFDLINLLSEEGKEPSNHREFVEFLIRNLEKYATNDTGSQIRQLAGQVAETNQVIAQQERVISELKDKNAEQQEELKKALQGNLDIKARYEKENVITLEGEEADRVLNFIKKYRAIDPEASAGKALSDIVLFAKKIQDQGVVRNIRVNKKPLKL